jgi:predicted ATPase/DNA-binding XRE family transcriptional regulator
MTQGQSRNEVSEHDDSFSTRLRGLRKDAGLTQQELAQRAGLSLNAVNALERGARKHPYPHTVRSLADALGLSQEGRSSLLAAVPGRGKTTAEVAAASELEASLPSPPTLLVGRERELEEVRELLLGGSAVRLLTLTGIGGVGKTRLAVEAAREAEDRFADGAAFVALASLSDPSLVANEILRSLGLGEAEGRTPGESLRHHLSKKRLLLLLDNLEHLLGAAAEVAGLIENCPNLVVLATSRGPLRLKGEQEYPVHPLALPSSTLNPSKNDVLGVPSGWLFLERARAVAPDFAISQDNAGDVAAICWRLAGLPLALELAAAKVRLLEPAALLTRLDRALSTAWTRDLPERQRTMRSTLDWSHDLLTEKERILFRRLSAFAGGFTIEDAEEVCGFGEAEPEEVLELLGRLLEQSLVTVSPAADGSRCYGMLEPVRQYALELLEESGEVATTRERHTEHFLSLAETARRFLLGPEHQVWSGRLDREHDNLRGALRWAQNSSDVCIGLRFVGALSWFWWMGGYLEEGRRWAEGLLSKPFDEGLGSCLPARAGALWAAGELAFAQGDLAPAVGRFEESLALYRGLGDDTGIAAVLVELGQVTRAQGDHVRAAALSEGSLDRCRNVDDARVAAIAHSTLGRVERYRGNTDGAIAHYEESLALFRRIGHGWGSAYVLANLAVAAHDRRDLERALALNEESLSIYSGLGDKSGMALALINLGDVAREQGEEERAVALYDEAAAMYRELGNERGMARALRRLAPAQ